MKRINRELPSVEEIANKITYDPLTGVVRFRKTGKPVTSNCRAHILFKSGRFLISRVIYKLHYGVDPGQYIVDHKNCNDLDQRADNLRLGTQQENCMNKRKSKTTLNKYKGVYKKKDKYHAAIQSKYLGSFDTAYEAHIAYRTAAVQKFGEFARFE